MKKIGMYLVSVPGAFLSGMVFIVVGYLMLILSHEYGLQEIMDILNSRDMSHGYIHATFAIIMIRVIWSLGFFIGLEWLWPGNKVTALRRFSWLFISVGLLITVGSFWASYKLEHSFGHFFRMALEFIGFNILSFYILSHNEDFLFLNNNKKTEINSEPEEIQSKLPFLNQTTND